MKRDRIAVDFLGMHLNTPVTGASGTFGFGSEYEDFLDMEDVGAVISKGITPLPRPGNPGVRIAETPSGMLNCIGLENPGVDVFKECILPQAKKMPTKFSVNISAGSVEEYGELAGELEVDGVDALEVNISCPNVKEGGIVFGTDPKAAAAVTKSVREHTKKPVIVKLSPNVTDITGMAVDIDSRRPLLGNSTGGLSGPAVKPIALRMVWQTAKAVHIPVLGLGGIATWQDAIEFMLVGASAVSVGTCNFVNPRTVSEIAAGMQAWCEREGVTRISEIVGTLKA